MLESLNTSKYVELISLATGKITQEDVDGLAETLYNVAKGVINGDRVVIDSYKCLLERVSFYENYDEDVFVNHLVGIFVGLELAKQGGLDANKT